MGNRTDQRFLAAVKGHGTDPTAALKSWRRASSIDLGVLLVTVDAMIAKL